MRELPNPGGRTKSETKANAEDLADDVPHEGERIDDAGREQLAESFMQGSRRRDLLKVLAVAGGGVVAGLFADRFFGPAMGMPGSATSGTVITDTDLDAKRIAGIRIATEFMSASHAGTSADPFTGAAIQAALGDLPSGGGMVFLPAGVWNVAIPINVNQSNVRISGYGSATHLRTDGTGFTSNTSGMIQIAGNYTGEIVENLFMDGSNTDTCRGIVVSNGAEALIQSCEITNFQGILSQRGRGVSISQNGVDTTLGPFMQCVVSNCFFKNNQIGIVVHKTLFNLLGNRCLNNLWDGFYVDGNQGQGNIVGNTFQGGGRTGINLVASDRVNITGNYFLGNPTQVQILGSTGGASPAPCFHILVSGNIVDGATGGAGIYLASGSYYNLIIGNWIINQTTSPTSHGIFLYNGASSNLIVGNVCSGMSRNGIAITGGGGTGALPANNNLVEGNLCFDNGLSGSGWAGIMITGASGNRIRGNRCFDDQSSPTQSYGIAEASGANGNYYVNNDVDGNALQGILIVGATSVVRENVGWATESRGVATIPSGQSSVTVPHGLVAVPSVVVLGPNAAAAGAYWTATATNLTIAVPSAVGSSTPVAWKAEV